jgi:hypothetical protein
MRFSVHLCQRKFLNKHLRFSIHVSHALFIPPLVSKSYAPCFYHVRTFPVSLVMSPVHAMRVFVHSIYAWQKIHVWIQRRFQWSEAILDGSRMPRQYVRSVRGFSPYAVVWQAALTGGLEEPICQRTNTNLSALCICSWHVRDLRISTQIALPRPESHVNCSQMKTYCSDRIWGRRKGQHHRRWEN